MKNQERKPAGTSMVITGIRKASRKVVSPRDFCTVSDATQTVVKGICGDSPGSISRDDVGYRWDRGPCCTGKKPREQWLPVDSVDWAASWDEAVAGGMDSSDARKTRRAGEEKGERPVMNGSSE